MVFADPGSYVLQLDGTLLWAWKFCRYSRIVVISAVIISEVDCDWMVFLHNCEMLSLTFSSAKTALFAPAAPDTAYPNR